MVTSVRAVVDRAGVYFGEPVGEEDQGREVYVMLPSVNGDGWIGQLDDGSVGLWRPDGTSDTGITLKFWNRPLHPSLWENSSGVELLLYFG